MQCCFKLASLSGCRLGYISVNKSWFQVRCSCSGLLSSGTVLNSFRFFDAYITLALHGDSRLGLLLDVLRLCITLFEYGGKVQKSLYPSMPRPRANQDMKAKLEEVLLGNKGAAREMIQRHSRVMLGNVVLIGVPILLGSEENALLQFMFTASPYAPLPPSPPPQGKNVFLFYSITYSFIHLFLNSFIHSLSHSLAYSLIHSFTHSFLLPLSIQSFIYS